MRRSFKFRLVLFVMASLSMFGCQKENENGDNSGDSGQIQYQEPIIVSTQEVVNNGKVIIEALFDDESKMYFILRNSSEAVVTNWRSYYDTDISEGYVYRGDVVIPSVLEHKGSTYSIVGILDSAFKNCSLLESVVIPNSIEVLEQYAFANCRDLKTVSANNPELSISQYCFSNCSSLTSFHIPDSTTIISRGTFENCVSLTSIIIPNSVKIIGGGGEMWDKYESGAFQGCSNLVSVFFGNGIEEIYSSAFYGCASLVSAAIPNSVKKIGAALHEDLPYGAFQGCYNLSSVVLGDSINFIGDKTFMNCRNLTSIQIPSSVTTIGRGAFASTGLTSITIPNSIIVLPGAYAENLEHLGTFQNCTELSSAILGNSVLSLDLSFRGCSQLESITCYALNPPTLHSAFDQCDLNLIYVPSESVDLYKNDEYWSVYADKIVGL